MGWTGVRVRGWEGSVNSQNDILYTQMHMHIKCVLPTTQPCHTTLSCELIMEDTQLHTAHKLPHSHKM